MCSFWDFFSYFTKAIRPSNGFKIGLMQEITKWELSTPIGLKDTVYIDLLNELG